MTKVVISIVNWNHAKYLPDALRSIRAQTYPNVSAILVDNGSTDGSPALVRKDFPEVAVLQNMRNLGYSRAHNQAIQYIQANHGRQEEDVFVLVMNPDIILGEDFIARLMSRVGHRTDIGSAGGKLLRVYEIQDGDMVDKKYTDVIDSTGLRVYKSRRVVDRSAGEVDAGQFERSEEVFGVSGACALYRLRALLDVAPDGQFFDEDFFAYKEDVDLAWRLQLRGWKSLYVPEARAHHYRYLSADEKTTLWALLRGRRNRSKFRSSLSYRNHLLMLVKNEQVRNALLDWPRICLQESKKAVYLAFFEPTVLFKAMPQVIRGLPKAMRKRHRTMKASHMRGKEMRRWFA
jgi:GT2 family glycosyltransferase